MLAANKLQCRVRKQEIDGGVSQQQSRGYVQLDMVRETLRALQQIAEQIVSNASLDGLISQDHRREELVVERAAVPTPFQSIVLEDEDPVQVRPGGYTSSASVIFVASTASPHSQIHHRRLRSIRIVGGSPLHDFVGGLVRAENYN